MSTQSSKRLAKKATDRQSRKSWLEAALHALARGGIDRVRVESLAKDLGVTKGSFYWHFKDREQFFDEMLSFWAEQSTQTVITNVHYQRTPLQELGQLRRILCVATWRGWTLTSDLGPSMTRREPRLSRESTRSVLNLSEAFFWPWVSQKTAPVSERIHFIAMRWASNLSPSRSR